MIRFYCEQCCEHQPVEIESVTTGKLNPNMPWGDIVCKECGLVITTISTDLDKQGKYAFIKINDTKVEDEDSPSRV